MTDKTTIKIYKMVSVAKTNSGKTEKNIKWYNN